MPRSPWTGESGQPIVTAMAFAPERRPAARDLRQRRDPGEKCGLARINAHYTCWFCGLWGVRRYNRAVSRPTCELDKP